MKSVKLSSIIFVLFLFGCDSNTSEDSTSESGLRLNQGKKWEVNAATVEGLERIDSLMILYQDSTDQMSNQRLQAHLRNEFKTIFDKCDMEGPGHDMLHEFLYPFMGMFKRLEDQDPQVVKESKLQIQTHLELFPSYFYH